VSTLCTWIKSPFDREPVSPLHFSSNILYFLQLRIISTMRKIILKLNFYIHALNLDHVFTFWLINTITLKIYKRPNFPKMGHFKYEIKNRKPLPIHQICNYTKFIFSPNTLRQCRDEYKIRRLYFIPRKQC